MIGFERFARNQRPDGLVEPIKERLAQREPRRDVAPVDLTDPDQALRLRAYIWPELTERFTRMDAAIAEAHHSPPLIRKKSAGNFVAEVLASPVEPNATRAIVHSVVWQYIPVDERAAITAAIEAAGAVATSDAPLAWISLEANRDTHRHELTVRWWPGGAEVTHLATAHPHGAWVEWEGSRRRFETGPQLSASSPPQHERM